VGAQGWSFKSVADKGGDYPVEVPDNESEAIEAFWEDGRGWFTSFGCLEQNINGVTSTSLYLRTGNGSKSHGDEIAVQLDLTSAGLTPQILPSLKYANGAYYTPISLMVYATMLHANLALIYEANGAFAHAVLFGPDLDSDGRWQLSNLKCLQK